MERQVIHISEFLDGSVSGFTLGTLFGQGTLLVYITINGSERYLSIENYLKIARTRKITLNDFK